MKRLTSMVAALACLLAAFVAPTAMAASTYDITQVGDASWVSITDSDGKELSGQTVASTNVPVTATIHIDINDMTALKEGDVVTVETTATKDSHFQPILFTDTNLPSYFADGSGRKLFTVRMGNSQTLRLVRTGERAQGVFSCDLQVSNTLWSENDATSSEWHIGKDSSYTFANQPTKGSSCESNGIYPGMNVSNGVISFGVWADNCATMATVARDGDTSAIGAGDVVVWGHATPETGGVVGTQTWASQVWVQRAYDENTPGKTYDDRRNAVYFPSEDADVSTLDAAKTNLKPGTYASQALSDGSWAIAVNFGSRLPGLANSLQVRDIGDETTLKLLAKTGHIWQNAQFGVFLHFADEATPNRVKIETQSTESAYQTKTLTTKPIEPPVGQGQSAIRYDPNTGDGDAFKKVGNPGTTMAVPAANTFTSTARRFVSWNTKPDGTGDAYQPGDTISYPAEGDTLTLYAQWERIPETTLPDTGGIMPHYNLTTILGGGMLVLAVPFILMRRRKRD